MPVVRKDYTVTNKDVVLDGYAVADESVTLDTTTATNCRTPLDLYKSADLRLIADPAAVQVRELVNDHATAQFNVRRYVHKFLFRYMQLVHCRPSNNNPYKILLVQ
jgi:hypothetical protein